MAKKITNLDRFNGAFIGFAVGDAFGYPARLMTFEQLCERFEKDGCLELAVSRRSGTALFTDATQMMLFTSDGIVWADQESMGREVNYSNYVFYAYQLWLYTQTKTIAGKEYAWLFQGDKNRHKTVLLNARGLYKNRYTEKTSINALLAARDLNYGRISSPVNSNSDNGGLKRVLAAGLYFNYDTELAFREGADFAAITHNAPSAYLSAGCYSAIIAEIINGMDIENAVKTSMRILKKYDGYQNVYVALDKMLSMVYSEDYTPREVIEMFGKGHRAEEALAISLFSACLHDESYRHAIQLAVNHDGESDVCAALTGGILGAFGGLSFIPKGWTKKLQYQNMILDMSEQLFNLTVFNDDINERGASGKDDDEDLEYDDDDEDNDYFE